MMTNMYAAFVVLLFLFVQVRFLLTKDLHSSNVLLSRSSYAPVLVNSKSNSSDWLIAKVWITMERAVMDRMVSSLAFNLAAHLFVSAFVTLIRISINSIVQCRWIRKNVLMVSMKRRFSVETPLISLEQLTRPIVLSFPLNSAGW